jgi:pellino
VLRALGLIAQGSWTSAAEPVLWRFQPREWEMEIWSDPRFAHAVEQALVTMPDGIRAEMDSRTTITEADVAAALARFTAAYEESLAKYGPKSVIGPPPTTETTRKSLESASRNALDCLFFRHWRFADGWLSPKEAERALNIFHDRLAIVMRRAVIARRYPDLPSLADE